MNYWCKPIEQTTQNLHKFCSFSFSKKHFKRFPQIYGYFAVISFLYAKNLKDLTQCVLQNFRNFCEIVKNVTPFCISRILKSISVVPTRFLCALLRIFCKSFGKKCISKSNCSLCIDQWGCDGLQCRIPERPGRAHPEVLLTQHASPWNNTPCFSFIDMFYWIKRPCPGCIDMFY